ncbi:MAG: translation initiation factor IF-2 [Spirochaetes bacterium]|nr:translation initiation factor IF-2 [Spirochaetota bacterium]
MTENSKGELIKKKTEHEQQQQKKKLIIKKVKKVVVKKQSNDNHYRTDKPVIGSFNEKQEKRDFGNTNRDNKDKNEKFNRDNKFKNNRFNYNKNENNSKFKQDNKVSDIKNDKQDKDKSQHFGKKKVFFKQNKQDSGQKQDLRNKKPFFKNQNFKPRPPANNVLQTTEKERSRKKVNKKNEDFNKKHERDNRKEEIRKAFFNRKQQKIHDIYSSIPQQIDIIDVISISDLAKKMNLKANIIISKLMELGTMVTINDKIDAETAEILCSEFNCKVKVVSLYDETVIEDQKVEETELKKRPPVVTVMGHVDHGKTKLLDAIRSTNVVDGESGGITQHIGAYSVLLKNGEKITFIDTPGHEAFTTMRARGANVTDIVILVVAADDGVMPQTEEAINHAKAANVPIIVAVNKIDKESSNIDRVKQQLVEYNLLPEEWGGQTLYCNVSALKKTGIDHLLDTIILQAEMMELKASYDSRAKGYVLESKIEPGRGVVSTVLVLSGTLKIGDFFVAGVYSGKIRAMYNDIGEKITEASPSTPVEITGIEKSPNAGDPFNVTETEKLAKLISAKRIELNKMEEAKSIKKLTIKELLSQQSNVEQQELKIIIKADVQGSVEALKDSLEKLSTTEIKIITVSAGVGAINESDVRLAVASKGIIIGFHVRANTKAQEIADKEKIEIKRYNIIYDVLEDIKASITGMIKPDLIEELIGTAEVKQVFKISKVGTVAGCMVTSGKIRRDSLIRIIRDDVEIYSGKMTTLKRFKDDASEVLEGTECGISIENYKDLKEKDILEAYIIKEIARKFDDIKRV